MTDRRQPSRAIDSPEPCFVRLRLIRGGPWVAGRITTRLGMLVAEINGQPADVERVWTSGHIIPESEYRALLGIADPPDPHTKVVMSGQPVF